MQLNQYIDSHRDDMVRWLQGCIRIPSAYADDGSGHPYGAQIARCLDYMLSLARELGFSVCDMDGPALCSEDPILGGAAFDEQNITVSDDPGLDIHGIQGLQYLN